MLLWVTLAGGCGAVARRLPCIFHVRGLKRNRNWYWKNLPASFTSQSMAVDVEFYENAHDHNLMSRAQQEALSRPQAIFSTIIQVTPERHRRAWRLLACSSPITGR